MGYRHNSLLCVSLFLAVFCVSARGVGTLLATAASGWTSLVELGTGGMHAPLCARSEGKARVCGIIVYRWGDRVVARWDRREPGQAARVGYTVVVGDDPDPTLTELRNQTSSLTLEGEANSYMFAISTAKSVNRTATSIGDMAVPFLLSIGANGLSAVGSIQAGVSERFAVGLTTSFIPLSKIGLTNNLIGAFLTLNYFPAELWKRIWIQAGLGYFSGTTHYRLVSGRQSGLSGLATFGWRESWGNWSLGIAGGVHYTSLTATSEMKITFRSLSPTLWIDLGFAL